MVSCIFLKVYILDIQMFHFELIFHIIGGFGWGSFFCPLCGQFLQHHLFKSLWVCTGTLWKASWLYLYGLLQGFLLDSIISAYIPPPDDTALMTGSVHQIFKLGGSCLHFIFLSNCLSYLPVVTFLINVRVILLIFTKKQSFWNFD